MRDSITLFTKLLSSAESSNNKFFEIETANKIKSGDIARASAQLIEICSWLRILPIIKERLKGLSEYLQSQTALDQVQMYAHPSRLRSLLQISEFDFDSFENSIVYLIEHYSDYLDDKTLVRLAYTDFMGTLVHYAKKDKLPENFPKNIKIIKDADRLHKLFLESHWHLIINRRERKNIIPRDFSYAMWLLFLSGYYDGYQRNQSLERHLNYLEGRIVSIATIERLQKYHQGDFSRIVYPHIFLYFIERKRGRKVKEQEHFLNWLSICAKHLIGNFDGYHAGLFLKLILAIDKEEFFVRFMNCGVSALIEKRIDNSNISASEMNMLEDVLRNSTNVELDDVRRLTGGWSSAHVYSVNAKIHAPLTLENISRTKSKYIIKIGPPEVLKRSSVIYDTLPEEGKKLVAFHDQKINAGTIGSGEQGYGVIEYLEEYDEYASLVKNCLPSDGTQASQNQKLVMYSKASLSLIKRLHSITPKSIRDVKEPPAFEYRIGKLLERLDGLARKQSYLDVAINRGIFIKIDGRKIRINTARYNIVKLLNMYHNIPLTGRYPEDKSRNVIVHGDCHGNNIMINNDGTSSRFIDIGNIHVDDYLIDYSHLVAHVCISMNLEQYSNEELTWFIEQFGLKEGLGEFNILYPERRRGLSVVWDILINGMKEELEFHEKHSGIRRFSYYLADRLIFIASKSPSPIKSLILYLQGIYLLQSLVECIGKDRKCEKIQEVFIPPGDSSKLSI